MAYRLGFLCPDSHTSFHMRIINLYLNFFFIYYKSGGVAGHPLVCGRFLSCLIFPLFFFFSFIVLEFFIAVNNMPRKPNGRSVLGQKKRTGDAWEAEKRDLCVRRFRPESSGCFWKRPLIRGIIVQNGDKKSERFSKCRDRR